MKLEIHNHPKLSIIIPIYRVEAYLPKCLDSVCVSVDRVPAGSVEVICIDDGSTDASGRIADSYAKQHAYVRVIHQDNAGVAAARNTGIEWLHFVDSDDWLPQDSVELIFSAVTEHADTDVILMDAYQDTLQRSSAWEHFSKEMVWTTADERLNLQRRVLYFSALNADTECPMAAPWDKVYKREFLNRCGIRFLAELRVLDDMFFNMQVMGAASRVAFCKHKIYHYRYVPDSITNSYQEKHVEYDRVVWDAIERYIATKTTATENELLIDTLHCRIIKSFSIACRLSFFNRLNGKSLREKLRDVRAILGSEPYKRAFRDVNGKHLEWKLKWVRFMGRHGLVVGIYLLHLAQSVVSRKR